MEKTKRKTRISPTAMTKSIMKAKGIPCAVVEKWIKTPQGGFRKDCFGADLQCLMKDFILAIQAGTGGDHSTKVKHAIAHPEVNLWLQSPSRKFHVWTFSQRVHFLKSGAKGKKPKWTPRVTEIYLEEGELKARRFTLS